MYRKQIIVHSWTKMIHALIYRGSGGDGPPPPPEKSNLLHSHSKFTENVSPPPHPPGKHNYQSNPPPLRPEKKLDPRM